MESQRTKLRISRIIEVEKMNSIDTVTSNNYGSDSKYVTCNFVNEGKEISKTITMFKIPRNELSGPMNTLLYG